MQRFARVAEITADLEALANPSDAAREHVLGTAFLIIRWDRGGVHWGIIASLIETCKLNAVDPQAWLADVLDRLVNGWSMSKIDELMPWAYAAGTPERAVA